MLLVRESPCLAFVVLFHLSHARIGPRDTRDLGVILSREATKGSLSIQGFYGRGAKAILSLASLAQDDHRGRSASG